MAALYELLGEHFTHRGELFLPDDMFYVPLIDAANLQTMAKRLLTWLGTKPVNLTIRFSEDSAEPARYQKREDHHFIEIQSRYNTNPYQCGALLSRSVLAYVIQGKKKLELETAAMQEFIDLASVYAGFSLLVINGLEAKDGLLNRINLDVAWLTHMTRRPLGTFTMSLHDYLRLFTSYIREYAISPGYFMSHVAPAVRLFLPKKWQTVSRHRGLQPKYVQSDEYTFRQQLIKFVGILGIGIFLVFLSLFIRDQLRPALPRELAEEKFQLEVMHQSYELCEQSILDKTGSYNPNDHFMQRDLEATENRCLSLKNRYNSGVEAFNTRLHQLK